MRLVELLQTPERREEAAREQAKRREKNSHLVASHPAHAKFRFGQARVQSTAEQIKAILDGELSGGDNSELRTQLYDQMAEGYAHMGMLEEATALCLDETRRREYAAKAEAAHAPGVKLCECPEEVRRKSKVDAKGERVETQSLVEEIWDGEKLITFFKCVLCGTLSAK